MARRNAATATVVAEAEQVAEQAVQAGRQEPAPLGKVAKFTPNGKRHLPWASMGPIFEGPTSAMDALEAANLQHVHIGTRQAYWKDDDGTERLIDNQRTIVRYPIPGDEERRVLGTCSDEYTILQNTDIAKALDAAGVTRKWPVCAVAAPDKGAGLFFALNMGASEIYGEAYNKYCVLNESRDGSSAITIDTFWLRLWCTNGCTVREHDSGRITINHTVGMGDQFALSLNLIDIVERDAEQSALLLEELADVPVATQDYTRLVEYVHPTPVKGQDLVRFDQVKDPSQVDPARLPLLLKKAEQYKYNLGLTEASRAAAHASYERLCDEFPRLAGNGLGACQAIFESTDWARSTRRDSLATVVGYRAAEKLRAIQFVRRMA